MIKGEFRFRPSAHPGIDLVEAETAHVFPRHTHEQFGVGLVRRGAQISHSGRGQVEAGPGDIITVNPGEVHDGAPVGGRSRSWTMIYLDPQVISDFGRAMGDGKAPAEFHHPVLVNARIAAAFAALFAALDPDRNASGLAAESRVLMLLAELMAEPQAARPTSCSAAVRHIRAAIDDAPTASLTLADLAIISGLSRFQVLRGFAREIGMTPHAYQMQRRLDLAMRLIRRGVRLAEAAADSGFADQSHMTRLFASRYGITPGTYARAIG